MRRDNLLLSGLVLILLGPFLVFSGDPLLGASGVPISVAGIALLMWGSARSRTVNCPRRPSPPGDPSTEDLAHDARIRYRVDTTLDHPIRTTVLCGACGHVDLVEGGRPATHACSACHRLLWEEE